MEFLIKKEARWSIWNESTIVTIWPFHPGGIQHDNIYEIDILWKSDCQPLPNHIDDAMSCLVSQLQEGVGLHTQVITIVWRIMHHYGILTKMVNIIKDYTLTLSVLWILKVDRQISLIARQEGVRQGCILSPFLFCLEVDFVMRKTLHSSDHGIPWYDKELADLDFADDIALLGKDLSDIQRLTDKLIEEVAKSVFE